MDEIVALDGWVNEGDFVGWSGNTGYVLPAPTASNPHGGAHLHDELLIDGKYASLEDHLTKGDEVIKSKEEADLAYIAVLNRPAESDDAKEALVGKDWAKVLTDMVGSPEYLGQNHIIKVAYAEAQQRVAELEEALNAKPESSTKAADALVQAIKAVVKS